MRHFSFRATLLLILCAQVFVLSAAAFADGMEPELEPALKSNSAITSTARDSAATGSETSLKNKLPHASASIERAGGDDLAAALGHYAKARSLLIAAIHEFDSGYKLAKPDVLMDSKSWRENLISAARDLEHVLAPQPRITQGGVKFEGDSRLLKK